MNTPDYERFKAIMVCRREAFDLRSRLNNALDIISRQAQVINDLRNQLESLRRHQSYWMETRRLAAQYQIPQEQILQAIRTTCETLQAQARSHDRHQPVRSSSDP
jgi:hypothetical protein